MKLLALGEAELQLDAPVAKIHLRGNQRQALFLGLADQRMDLTLVQQEFAGAVGVHIVDVALFIGADMQADDEGFLIVDRAVAVLEVDASGPQRLYLGALELDAGLEGLLDEIIVECLAVGSDGF